MPTYLAVIGFLGLGLGLFSRRLRYLPVTEPLVALVLGVALGPQLLDVLELDAPIDALRIAAEISLALSLMSVAMRFDLDEIRGQLPAVAVLVTVVLLGMAGVSAGLAVIVLAFPAAGAWLLGAVLAPTDPVLSSSIVAGDAAERELPLRTRVVLSVESAANDGLSFALVALGIVAVTDGSLLSEAGLSAVELVIGVTAGIVIGGVAGRLLMLMEHHRDIEHSAFLMLTVSLALGTLGVVSLIGGQALLGVFTAGLAYNREISRSERSEEWEVQEAVNRYLVLPVFVLFGIALPWSHWGDLGWRGPVFVTAVLMLRRLPLVLAVRPLLRVGWVEAGFVGWFGPMGVAALFYLTEAAAEGALDERVWAAGTLVLAASTVVHGVTATPGRRGLGPAMRGSDREGSR
jgi:sodium/hydrogen antiporter